MATTRNSSILKMGMGWAGLLTLFPNSLRLDSASNYIFFHNPLKPLSKSPLAPLIIDRE
jgi:hypothetical protein